MGTPRETASARKAHLCLTSRPGGHADTFGVRDDLPVSAVNDVSFDRIRAVQEVMSVSKVMLVIFVVTHVLVLGIVVTVDGGRLEIDRR